MTGSLAGTHAEASPHGAENRMTKMLFKRTNTIAYFKYEFKYEEKRCLVHRCRRQRRHLQIYSVWCRFTAFGNAFLQPFLHSGLENSRQLFIKWNSLEIPQHQYHLHQSSSCRYSRCQDTRCLSNRLVCHPLG